VQFDLHQLTSRPRNHDIAAILATGLIRMKKNFLCACAAIIALGSGVTQAGAVELLTNGGFESGSFSGWTQNPVQTQDAVLATGAPAAEYAAQSGTYYAQLSYISGQSTATLSQGFADTSGQPLTVSFWLTADGKNPSRFAASFDGNLLQDFTSGTGNNAVVAARGWTEYTYSVLATGNDTLTFTYDDGGSLNADHPANLGLDTVSVASAVPEPSTWAMMILGFAGVGFMAYRRTKKPIVFRIA